MKVEVEETCTDKQNSNACLQHSLSIEDCKYRFNLAVEKNPIIPIHLENPIIKSKDIKHIFSIKHAEVVNR